MAKNSEIVKILENLIKDMANNLAGDESDDYMRGVDDCIHDVDRYIRCIQRGEN